MEEIRAGTGLRVLCDFQKPQKRTRKKAAAGTSRSSIGGKRKKAGSPSEDDDEDVEEDDDADELPRRASNLATPGRKRAQNVALDLEDSDDDDSAFTATLRRIDPTVLQSSSDAGDTEWVANPRPKKRSRTSIDDDVIVISP